MAPDGLRDHLADELRHALHFDDLLRLILHKVILRGQRGHPHLAPDGLRDHLSDLLRHGLQRGPPDLAPDE